MLSKSDLRYFKKARNAALVSDYKRVHIGAIAVYQGNIIGCGCNMNKTHPIMDYYNRYRNIKDDKAYIPKIHAEIDLLNSIRNMNIDFSKVKLYIYRTRKDRPFGLSKPCAACEQAIRDLGIRHVYYTSDNGYVYEKYVYLEGAA